jgi:hypothetical protein
MTDLLAAAERVKKAVEDADRYLDITQEELDKVYTYQFTMPTGPKPGFVYKREHWRIPGEERWWCGQNESAVRWAIAKERGDCRIFDGFLDSFWFVYTCELDPNDSNLVMHVPKEARVI